MRSVLLLVVLCAGCLCGGSTQPESPTKERHTPAALAPKPAEQPTEGWWATPPDPETKRAQAEEYVREVLPSERMLAIDQKLEWFLERVDRFAELRDRYVETKTGRCPEAEVDVAERLVVLLTEIDAEPSAADMREPVNFLRQCFRCTAAGRRSCQLAIETRAALRAEWAKARHFKVQLDAGKIPDDY